MRKARAAAAKLMSLEPGFTLSRYEQTLLPYHHPDIRAGSWRSCDGRDCRNDRARRWPSVGLDCQARSRHAPREVRLTENAPPGSPGRARLVRSAAVGFLATSRFLNVEGCRVQVVSPSFAPLRTLSLPVPGPWA